MMRFSGRKITAEARLFQPIGQKTGRLAFNGPE
jgi:hypothetical protein